MRTATTLSSFEVIAYDGFSCVGRFCVEPPLLLALILYLMLGENNLITREQTRSFSKTRNWKKLKTVVFTNRI